MYICLFSYIHLILIIYFIYTVTNYETAVQLHRKSLILKSGMLFSGRMSDIAYMTSKPFEVDNVLNVISGESSEIKVCEQKLMAVLPDRRSYKLCFLHAFLMFLATRGGTSMYPDKEEDSFFLFPELQSSPSTYVTKILRDISKESPHFDFLSGKSSSKQFRYGAVQTIFLSLYGGSEVASAHGGWNVDSKTQGAMVEYIICHLILVSRGARILSG